MMSFAPVALSIAALFALFFVARTYHTATPEQKRQIVFGGIGAVVLALTMAAFLLLR
jgi:hypothetical protein